MKQIDPYVFWNRVDGLIYGSGHTLRNMADATGIGYRTINAQRTRHTLPKIEQLLDMAEFLEVPLEYLITGEKKKPQLSQEALEVEKNPELQALVRYCLADRNLLYALQLVVKAAQSDALAN